MDLLPVRVRRLLSHARVFIQFLSEGSARITLFAAAGNARTFDYQASPFIQDVSSMWYPDRLRRRRATLRTFRRLTVGSFRF